MVEKRTNKMEELLKGLKGKKIDVSCGTTAVFRGTVSGVEDGVLHIIDDDERTVYIAVSKIATVMEYGDSAHRPGFIG